MPTDKVDINFYILQFRRLAARHQSGESLTSITEYVEGLIKSFETKIQNDFDYQITKWGELSRKLTLFTPNTADPKWVTVIAYARKRINAKKHTAIHRRKKHNS